jgi:hypothetical protein
LLQGENDFLREKNGEVKFKLDRVFDGLNNKLERATEVMLTGRPIIEELLQCQAILHELKSTPSNNDHQHLSSSSQQQGHESNKDTFSPRGYYKK